MIESENELKLFVPTNIGNLYPATQYAPPEFDKPYEPVLVREANGVRIVLGTHVYSNVEKPDVLIERRPNGWVVFLHPLGRGDASGIVCFHDDGRSYLLKEWSGPTPPIVVLEPGEKVPAFHFDE